VTKTPDGFISLKSLKQGPSPDQDPLALIRQIYFKTTRQTIDNDLAHAIELLKELETEEQRERATAYMHGLAELQKEWSPAKKGARNRQRTKDKRRK
jgi:hypothetical protein